MRQTDSAAHKLKPRLFYKSAHFWVHSIDFYLSVNRTWQYYQTSKSAVVSEQFCLLNPLLQFHLKSISLYTSKSKWLPLAIILQLRSHRLEHSLKWFCVLVTRWLIHQMYHNVQDKSIKDVMGHFGYKQFLFSFSFIFWFDFLFLFFWTIKRYMTSKSHDWSHDMTL